MDFAFEQWPTIDQQILEYFGQNPFRYLQFGLPGHEGIDLGSPFDSPVLAITSGVVRRVNLDDEASADNRYGRTVRVRHTQGYETTYAHLNKIGVQVGQRVRAGDQIGTVGFSGAATYPHLMLILHKLGQGHPDYPDDIVDPMPFLAGLIGWEPPAAPVERGWAYLPGLTVVGDLAQVAAGGSLLRSRPTLNSTEIGLAPGGTILKISGNFQRRFAPVQLSADDLQRTNRIFIPIINVPPSPITGWVAAGNLVVLGSQASVRIDGAILFDGPAPNATRLGRLSFKLIVEIIGRDGGDFVNVRLQSTDLRPLVDEPIPNTIRGWVPTGGLDIGNQIATIRRGGVSIFAEPERNAVRTAFIPAEVRVDITGIPRGLFTPIEVDRDVIQDAVSPGPLVTNGWVPSGGIRVNNRNATATAGGVTLRRNASTTAFAIGFIPAGGRMTVTGNRVGFFTPVSVRNEFLRRIDGDPQSGGSGGNNGGGNSGGGDGGNTGGGNTGGGNDNGGNTGGGNDNGGGNNNGGGGTDVDPNPVIFPPNDLPPSLGDARLGLHASADPLITEAEHREFADARTDMIKVLSFHSREDIQRLANAHPRASWVVRAFLEFRENGDIRNISPQRFFNDTVTDISRSLAVLAGKEVVVELHNEPNLTIEGMRLDGRFNWSNGITFAEWWFDVLSLYRQRFPNMRFIYPGLSPGANIGGLRQEHTSFIEQSRWAVESADGLGVHIYWSKDFAITTALNVLDDYIARFPNLPIYITEASNNGPGRTPGAKANEYILFWEELQKRPTVQGVTYFVASASDPQFADEVWVGNGIGALVGRR